MSVLPVKDGAMKSEASPVGAKMGNRLGGRMGKGRSNWPNWILGWGMKLGL